MKLELLLEKRGGCETIKMSSTTSRALQAGDLRNRVELSDPADP